MSFGGAIKELPLDRAVHHLANRLSFFARLVLAFSLSFSTTAHAKLTCEGVFSGRPFVFSGEIDAYDRDAWFDLLQSSSVKARSTVPLFSRQLVDEMPDSLRRRLLARIGVLYMGSQKTDHRATNRPLYFPKRMLDYWIRTLIPADRIISSELTNGRTPIEALQTYFDRINETIFTREMRSAGYGNLTATEVLSAGVAIANFIRHQEDLHPGIFGRDPRFVLFGSFVSGLSKFGSDIDLSATEQAQMRFLRDNQANVPLRESLFSALSPVAERNRLDHSSVRNNITSAEFIERRFSVFSPFHIEITRDEIKLLVYSRDVTRLSPAKQEDFGERPALYQAEVTDRIRLWSRLQDRP